MLKSNIDLCPACNGEKKVKVIKNIIQIGPYHLGKEKFEKCKFCEVFEQEKSKYDLEVRTIN